ncbi:hypothetical protein IV102_23640 [bacterium]|nr:hypothetical protein [bacterium]
MFLLLSTVALAQEIEYGLPFQQRNLPWPKTPALHLEAGESMQVRGNRLLRRGAAGTEVLRLPQLTLELQLPFCQASTLSEDGAWLATADGRKIRVLHCQDGRETFSAPCSGEVWLGFSRGLLLAVQAGLQLEVHDPTQGPSRSRLALADTGFRKDFGLGANLVSSCWLSADRDRVYCNLVYDGGQHFLLVDRSGGKLTTLEKNGPGDGSTFTPLGDASYILASHFEHPGDGGFRLEKVVTESMLHWSGRSIVQGQNRWPQGGAAGGARVAYALQGYAVPERVVEVLDFSAGTRTRLEPPEALFYLGLTGDGKYLVLMGRDSGDVYVQEL